MHEILRGLPEWTHVLDLGSASGSFDSRALPLYVTRVDLEPAPAGTPDFVQADAALLPFRDGQFMAVISNHSLEHFDNLESALREIGRVLAPGGSLYIAVPDASTLTDRFYKWLARGGGHVNSFTSPLELIATIERATGLRHTAGRVLCTSLSYLNRHNWRGKPSRRMRLLGGREFPLVLALYLFRLWDRWFDTRASIYGWALYFGTVYEAVDELAWTNVCMHCSSGHSSNYLRYHQYVQRSIIGIPYYRCPTCDAVNLFTDDRAIPM